MGTGGESRGPAEVRLYAELNDFVKRPSARRLYVVDVDGHRSVKDAVESLGVPHTEIDLLLVNGEPAGFDHPLRAGDRVSAFPVFERFDIGPVTLLPRRPLRATRFVADGHLGTLARHLRLLGFDTAYANDADDDALAATSAQQGRVLLTRDRGLLMRRAVTHGLFVRDDDPEEQAIDVVRRLQLAGHLRPFTRCTRCNGELSPVDKASVVDELPPRTRREFDRFLRCGACGQIYWAGSHLDRLVALVERIRTAARAPARGGAPPPRSTPRVPRSTQAGGGAHLQTRQGRPQ